MVDIYDMEGVGWKQLASGMRLLSGVLSVAQEHYPENLNRAFLINAPKTFAGAWKLISAAIDSRTKQKFVISKVTIFSCCFEEMLKHSAVVLRTVLQRHWMICWAAAPAGRRGVLPCGAEGTGCSAAATTMAP